MVSPYFFLLCLITLSVILLKFFFPKHNTIRKPPGPRRLPIIGNLHQLINNSSTLHLHLFELSKIYGPFFSLQLGSRPAIVVSSPKLAEEVLKNHGLVFSGRPALFGQRKLSYNGLGILFSQNNHQWRELKKLCTLHTFNPNRVSYYSSIREFEVKQMMKTISRNTSLSADTNLSELMISLTSTIICRIAFGRSYSQDEGTERRRFHELLNEFQANIGSFFVSDYIPFMGWFDKLMGLHASLERNFKELDNFYQQVINDRINHKNSRQDAEEEVIVDVLLRLKKERSFSIDLTYNHIKAVIMNMLIGATSTTASTSLGAMTSLIQNPRVMKKVQEEIRNFGGKKDFLDEDDIQKLPYFKAVIKETLRLHLPAPLLVPREANEDCNIYGYHIQAKTIVYVNAWAIHRDPEAWKDPEEFCPERFLDNAIDFKGLDFEFIPFGAGRRMCPGLPMGIATLELVLANLLHSFDWEVPQGLVKEGNDTKVLPGLVQSKKNSLCLAAKKHTY